MRARTDAEHKAKMVKLQAAQARKIAGKTVEKKGLVIVLTSPGKAKTSAAQGMVVRAVGHGMKAGGVRFVRGAMATGERTVLLKHPFRDQNVRAQAGIEF